MNWWHSDERQHMIFETLFPNVTMDPEFLDNVSSFLSVIEFYFLLRKKQSDNKTKRFADSNTIPFFLILKLNATELDRRQNQRSST